MAVAIRGASAADAPLIVEFIEALAEYEKLSHEAEADEADIVRDLYGPSPKVFCEIAEWDGEPDGFGLWFYTYSTFLGRHGIWLEDLFVYPEHRGKGIGKALMQSLAQRCVREDLGRFEWNVLDWNKPAKDFYRARGAVLMDGWERCRVTGDALKRLGSA